ncbi:MAG: sigma-70 family RNA polymerase sigma factor [Ruminococcus sp.]|nr:sigma-70 family RNA polymerase sigma factor [Ruminococcus sp.]
MERSNIINSETVKLAANGDSTAFDAIYRVYKEKIYYYLIKLGAKPQDAEDLVSETFLEAMKHISELKNEKGLSAWLHTIAKNKFFAQGRKESRHQRVELLADDEDNASDGLELAMQHRTELEDDQIMLPEDYAESEETKEILAQMINSLNDDQREAIYLFYHRDKTLEQISNLTGASVNTVKSRIHQAKNHLHKKIDALQAKGFVLFCAPVSAMFMAVDGRVKIKSGYAVPRVFSSFSSKVVAAACAAVVGGTGIMMMNGMKRSKVVVDHESMNVRPDSSFAENDSSRGENKSVADSAESEDESRLDTVTESSVPDDTAMIQAVQNDNMGDVYVPETQTAPQQPQAPQPGPAQTTDNDIISTLPLITMGTTENAFTAQSGDVIKYDLTYKGNSELTALQLNFDIPEGIEYVGVQIDESTMTKTFGFDNFAANHVTDPVMKELARWNDYTFVGYDTFQVNKRVSADNGIKIGSLFMRLKENATKDNIDLFNYNKLAINNINDEVESLKDSEFDLELTPVGKADQKELSKAMESVDYEFNRYFDQDDYDDLEDYYDLYYGEIDSYTTDEQTR